MTFDEALKKSRYVKHSNGYGIDYYYISDIGFEYSIRENGGKPIIQLATFKVALNDRVMNSKDWEVAEPSEKIRNFFDNFEKKNHIEIPHKD